MNHDRRNLLLGFLGVLAIAAVPAALEAKPRRSAKAAKPRKKRARGSGGGGSQGGFSSCKQARAAGRSRMRRGDPGYSARLDRDGDGIACE